MDTYSEALYKLAWEHIRGQRFDQAERLLRTLIGRTDPNNAERLWTMFGLLAGVLNSQSRFVEGTEMYRRQLTEARTLGETSAVSVARYMLSNQLLLFGDPAEALAEAQPVPPGSGDLQCLLHSVAAQALWKLRRSDEAREVAAAALASSPTEERRLEMLETLRDVLKAG